MVKLNGDQDFSHLLPCLPASIVVDILSYHNFIDRQRAFTSAILKYYTLPLILNISPDEIVICQNMFGKPYLPDFPEVDFNISHSGEYVILAVAIGHNVGVDIELIDSNVSLSDIANAVFTEKERQQIKTRNDFYLLWSKKEAYLKCIGDGFQNNLFETTSFDTTIFQQFSKFSSYAVIWENYSLALCFSNEVDEFV